MSDRIAVMNNGIVEQQASPQELYERPASAFVAGFIGTSNLLDLRVDERETGILAMRLGDSHRILAPDDGQPTGAPRQITVRPEKIKLSADGIGGEVSCVQGTVADVVYLGSMTQIMVELPSGERLVVHRLNDDLSAKKHEVGMSIELYWACDHSFVIGSGAELPVVEAQPAD